MNQSDLETLSAGQWLRAIESAWQQAQAEDTPVVWAEVNGFVAGLSLGSCLYTDDMGFLQGVALTRRFMADSAAVKAVGL